MSSQPLFSRSIDIALGLEAEVKQHPNSPLLKRLPMPAAAPEPDRATRVAAELARSAAAVELHHLASPHGPLSYVFDGIFLGSVHAARDADKLAEFGVTHVIDCTCDEADGAERVRHAGVAYLAAPVVDRPGAAALLSRHFRATTEWIHLSRQRGGKLLVHCSHGRSRGSSIVLAYLLRRGGADCRGCSLREALEHLRRRRVGVAPNVGFMGELIRLERELHGEATVQLEEYAAESLLQSFHDGFVGESTHRLVDLHLCRRALQEAPLNEYGFMDASMVLDEWCTQGAPPAK